MTNEEVLKMIKSYEEWDDGEVSKEDYTAGYAEGYEAGIETGLSFLKKLKWNTFEEWWKVYWDFEENGTTDFYDYARDGMAGHKKMSQATNQSLALRQTAINNTSIMYINLI